MDTVKLYLRSMGMLPCGYHRYYFNEKAMLEHSLEEFRKGGTRAEQMDRVEAELLDIYRQPGLHEKPAQLALRGGAFYSDAACECISAIFNDKHQRMTVSTRNGSAVKCLPEDCVVEVSALISASGAEPLAWDEIRPSMRGWLQMMKAMEECVIGAAVTGDYGLACEAFALNPMIENGEESKQVLDELMVAHEKYLPQFKETIAILKEKGIASSDPVVKALMEKGL